MPASCSTVARIAARLCVALTCMLVATPSASAAKPSCKHTVKKGDTLSRIAVRNGVSEKHLIRANRELEKNPNRLRIGQTIDICRAKRIQESRPQKCGDSGRIVRHKVGRGETLGAIAARYSVSRDSVRKYNKRLKGRPNDMIRVGETLRVCTTNRRYTHRSWLKEGVQLPPGDGYNVRRPHNAWGTPAAVASIKAAMARYRKLQPDAPLVQIGDISRQNGGPLREHVSHQEGRDVDIGYVFEPPEEGSNRKKIDIPRSWNLIRSFVDDDNLAVIFIDYKLQRRLYEYAQSIGVDQARLDAIFEYPRSGDDEAVLYHWRGHTLHFHVRFKDTPSKTQPSEVQLKASFARRSAVGQP